MTTFYDVPANFLIPALADQLKSNAAISMPDWADVVKTGSSRERPPTQTDWWQTRAAALCARLHVKVLLASQRSPKSTVAARTTVPNQTHLGLDLVKSFVPLFSNSKTLASFPLNLVAWLNQKVVKQHNCSTDVSSLPLATNSSMKSHTVFDHKLKKPIQASTSTEWM